MEAGSNGNNNNLCISSSGLASVPYKIQRTTSNSTIDSADGVLGPAGLGILGVDYVQHVVLPTDTLQGICLTYKINSTKLKMANHFSGNSLNLAPKKLVIPISAAALRQGFLRVQDTDAKEYKLHAFLAEFCSTGAGNGNSTNASSMTMSMVEAKGYLELADWDLPQAIASARADQYSNNNGNNNNNNNNNNNGQHNNNNNNNNGRNNNEWDSTKTIIPHHHDPSIRRAGEIHISGRIVRGAGIQTPLPKTAMNVTASTLKVRPNKNVSGDDLVYAAPQHDQCGVELQPVKSV
jgi:LysM repeat protein